MRAIRMHLKKVVNHNFQYKTLIKLLDKVYDDIFISKRCSAWPDSCGFHKQNEQKNLE